MSTKYVKAFKLAKICRCILRGSEKIKRHRIYGNIPEKAELEEYLNMLG